MRCANRQQRSHQQGRQRRQAMAVIELIMVLGVLFTGAWSILEVGGVACQTYLKYVAFTVLWPLL